MAEPPIGVVIPQTPDHPRRPAFRSIGEWARLAEDSGYESLWIGEGWDADSFVQLTEAACHTRSVLLGTSIVNVFSRTPAALAMAATTLDRISNGRALLGLGAGHPEMIENLHSMAYRRPLRRTDETIRLVKAFTDGEADTVEFAGELFEVGGYAPLGGEVPVYNAALGESNRRITGRLCDGWIPYNIPFPALDAAFETIARAAEDAGRDADDIVVRPWIPAAVSDDREHARDVIRLHVASHVGERDEIYKNAVAQEYSDEVTRIARAWQSGDREVATANVTDEMVDELGVAGTPDAARAKLFELIEETVIDVPLIATPYTVPNDTIERTIRALAPKNAGT